MGSLRNPIGPLPSSIYWRRRAVALALLAVIALLVIWAFGWGGSGGGGSDEGKGPGGGGPARTITPGPTSSGPVNSERPGGRDESDTGGTGDGPGSGSGSGSDDSGGDGGTGTGSGGAAGDGGTGGTGATGGTGDGLGEGDGRGLPVGSSLAECKRGDVELRVRSVKDAKVKNTYEPDEKPTFEITVKNSSNSSCAVDFGRDAASLTITDADNQHVWASDDCPKGTATALIEVPASGETKRTVEWDRERSAAHCATPKGGKTAAAGTYLVEAELDGLGTDKVSIVLAKD